MPAKLKQEEVIKKFREVHGDFYDYSKVVYVDSKTKVCIICPIHGEFWQTPYVHYKQKCGCPKCGHIETSKAKTSCIEDFIEKARVIHNNKYSYEKTVYINSKQKVVINCPIHGDFEQRPNSHLNGRGCPICAKESVARKLASSKESFVKLARAVHGDKYGYDKTIYISNNKKVVITCPIHGDFEQLPSNHTRGAGCPKCKSERIREIWRSNTEEFIKKAINIHGNAFDYSLSVYVRKDEKIKIICRACGRVFEQTPNSHLCGTGCPYCQSSRGEMSIMKFLTDNNILFERQYRIKNTTNHSCVDFFKVDFFLPNKNLIIEYNGEQHYHSVEKFGGEDVFMKQQQRDTALRDFCKNKKINLVEIPYTEFGNINNILKEKIKL